MVVEEPGRPDFQQRWLKLALPHFHRLGGRAADTIRRQGALTEEAQGYSIDHEGRIYWIPKTTALGGSFGLLHREQVTAQGNIKKADET